jgi:hypothetical protein
MPSVTYDVELIRQEQNPICWVACLAMVKGFQTKTSVGVGEFTGGFDPSNSCIANLARDWQQNIDLLTQWGFTMSAVSDIASSGTLAPDDLLAFLQNGGPAILLHQCSGFPYGSQWGTPNFGPNDRHAVVITNADTDANTATFNNPWGDKDQGVALDVLLAKINSDQTMGKTLGVWHS